MPDEFAALAEAYELERPLYELLARDAQRRLEATLVERGIHALVTARAKETTSFVIKALVGERYADPLNEIRDKAGVRIIVPYSEDVSGARDAVYGLFHVINEESKLEALSYDQNGYLGVHLEACYQDGQAPTVELVGKVFEVQIRTIAQWAWAEVSHEQLYKPPAELPIEMQRRVYRLVSLVELFDSEVDRFLEDARSTPGFQEAQVLVPLRQQLLERFGVRRRPDRRLSMLIVGNLVPLYDPIPPKEVFAVVLEGWINEHENGLKVQFGEAHLPGSNPLLSQPEIFIVFERLDNDRLRLDQNWPESVPRSWLIELAGMWGVSLE